MLVLPPHTKRVRREEAFPPQAREEISSRSSPNAGDLALPVVSDEFAESRRHEDLVVGHQAHCEDEQGAPHEARSQKRFNGLGLDHEYVNVVDINSKRWKGHTHEENELIKGEEDIQAFDDSSAHKSNIESVTRTRLSDAADLSESETGEQASNTGSGESLKRKASDREISDAGTEAHAFRLFSSTRKRRHVEYKPALNALDLSSNASSSSHANLIRLQPFESLAERNATSYSRRQKPLSSYLIDQTSPEHLKVHEQLHKSTMSGEDVIARAKVPCPGMRYSWRVISLPSASERKNNPRLAKSSHQSSSERQHVHLDQEPKRHKARKGKKARIKLRIRLRGPRMAAQQASTTPRPAARASMDNATRHYAAEPVQKRNLSVSALPKTTNDEEKQRKETKDKEKQRERNRKKQRKKREKARQREQLENQG